MSEAREPVAGRLLAVEKNESDLPVEEDEGGLAVEAIDRRMRMLRN